MSWFHIFCWFSKTTRLLGPLCLRFSKLPLSFCQYPNITGTFFRRAFHFYLFKYSRAICMGKSDQLAAHAFTLVEFRSCHTSTSTESKVIKALVPLVFHTQLCLGRVTHLLCPGAVFCFLEDKNRNIFSWGPNIKWHFCKKVFSCIPNINGPFGRRELDKVLLQSKSWQSLTFIWWLAWEIENCQSMIFWVFHFKGIAYAAGGQSHGKFDLVEMSRPDILMR